MTRLFGRKSESHVRWSVVGMEEEEKEEGCVYIKRHICVRGMCE